MSDKKDTIDIQDFDKELDLLMKMSNPIQSNFQAIVFDYINKISNKIVNSPIGSVRTDLLFRLQSIFYFARIMAKEESIVLTYFNNNYQLDQLNKIELLDELILKQKSIFDTILYHLSSIYDYFSYMSGYLYKGQGLKWNSLVKLTNSSKKYKIGENQKQLIIDSHKVFANSLFKHRSYLIHQSSLYPGFKYTNITGTDMHSIEILTPKMFIKDFKVLNEEIGENDITLKAAIFWALKFGLKNINDLSYGMKDELERHRKIDKGKEVYIDDRFPENGISTLSRSLNLYRIKNTTFNVAIEDKVHYSLLLFY